MDTGVAIYRLRVTLRARPVTGMTNAEHRTTCRSRPDRCRTGAPTGSRSRPPAAALGRGPRPVAGPGGVRLPGGWHSLYNSLSARFR